MYHLVFACLFFCQEKKLSIYFPYSENLKTLVKSKQLLRNALKFLALSLVIVALASPITSLYYHHSPTHWRND
jgi:hypothetical protein